MALRPRWRQEPFELLASADFNGRTSGVNYDLLFPYAVPISTSLHIEINNLKVYDATPDDLQDTKIQFQYNGTLYTSAVAILASTRSTLGDLTSYVSVDYRPLGYDGVNFYYTLQELAAYGTGLESLTAVQYSQANGSPSTVTLTGIRLTHSSSFVTNQAKIKVYKPR